MRTPEQFRRIEELYHAAREVSGSERAAILEQTDPEMRLEVEQLLARAGGGEFLDRPAVQNAPELLKVSIVGRWEAGAFLGPYQIKYKLGEGGMGQVFLAFDTRLGRSVAIKTVQAQFSSRFEREARAIASLNHPNICTLYDIGPDYLVMEFIDGETLAGRLKRGPLPPTTALQCASQVASALNEAHSHGIIHRDLKPGNIMIAKSGVKVLDFGLAKREGDQTLTGERRVMGTPAYMAPEQREGKPGDARTDIYAFGWILYEMLTAEHARMERRRLRARKLENIVSRCLENDPGRRWQSAAELQRELTAVPLSTRIQKAAVVRSRVGAPEFTRKNLVVLGEFENKTGNPTFDGILRQGLAMQLEQSTSLALVSDQRVQRVLRFMNRAPETQLTHKILQEICERTSGIAMVDGSIARLGRQYVICIRAKHCHSGDILAQEQLQAERKEGVLNALTRVAMQVRIRLEGLIGTFQEQPTALQEVTTTSLEALKVYSAARKALFTRGFAAAISPLRRAIAIDPEFAMAHADLGFFYWNMGQTDLAMEPTLRAYALLDRVSERERFFILFLYDRQVTGNLHKELETIEAWVQAYPRDFQAWAVMAGWGTRGTGQYERGIKASEQSLRINPDVFPAYVSLFEHNLSLGRFDEAAAAMRRAANRKLELPSLLVGRYYLAFLNGDEAAMRREVDRARGNLEAEDWMAHHQALVLARSGQLRAARIQWRHTVQVAEQNGDPEKAAIYCAAEAVCEAHFGNCEMARERAGAALRLGRGRDVTYAAAFALVLGGDRSASEGLADDLGRRFPEDTPVQFEYLPTLRALFALDDKSTLKAIERLQTALPYDFAIPGTAFFAKFGGLYPAYVRGRAYLEAGMGREAEAEFQKILTHRGIVLADPIGALANLQLGRAYVISSESVRARMAYRDFLTLWKNADPDIPVLRQAQAEYRELGPTV